MIIYVAIALATLLITAVAIAYAMHRLWPKVATPADLIIFSIMGLGAAIQISPAIAWCLALLPPLNDIHDLYIVGIGGNGFTTQFRSFPLCSGLICASAVIAWAVCALTFLGRKNSRPPIFALFASEIDKLPVITIIRIGFLLSVAYFVAYYSYLGWGRIWKSDLTRFDYAYGADMMFGVIDTRIFVIANFLLSLPLAALALCSRQHIQPLALFSVFIFAVPALTLGSRRGTVLLSIIIVILWFRSQHKRLFFLPAAVICALSYIVPLIMRNEEAGSGFYYVARSIQDIGEPGVADVRTETIRVLCNYGQGFSGYVDAISLKKSGQNILKNTPSGYIPISFSPFPSFIDHYKKNYLPYHERVNVYTPYNSFAEAYSQSWYLGILFSTAFQFVAVLLIKLLGRFGHWGTAVSLIFFSSIVISFLHFQQYNIRQASRFYMYGMDFTLLSIMLLLILPRRQNSASQIQMQREPFDRHEHQFASPR